MSYAIEHIARTLKEARERKGLSQRALSAKAGVPQGHISKIENGAVDLRLSSLIELARVLDLELTLVPRKAVAAVRTIARGSEPAPDQPTASGQALKELSRLQSNLARLSASETLSTELARIHRQVRDLQHFRLSPPDVDALRKAADSLQTFTKNTDNLAALHRSLSQLQNLRNALAHAPALPPEGEFARPAYSIEEDDNG